MKTHAEILARLNEIERDLIRRDARLEALIAEARRRKAGEPPRPVPRRVPEDRHA